MSPMIQHGRMTIRFEAEFVFTLSFKKKAFEQAS